MVKLFWQWYISVGNRGGGEEEKTTTVTPPKVPAPDPADIARQMYGLYQQYFPQQFGLGEQRAGVISQALADPQFMTPEEIAAQQAIRGRETERLQEAMRTRANLGGGLFGGRAALAEQRGVSQLGQAFAQQDIGNRQARLMGLLGLGGGISPGGVIPGAQQIYGGELQTAMQAAPQLYHQFAQASPWWGIGGAFAGGLGQGLGGKWGSSRRFKKNIKLWAKHYNSSQN